MLNKHHFLNEREKDEKRQVLKGFEKAGGKKERSSQCIALNNKPDLDISEKDRTNILDASSETRESILSESCIALTGSPDCDPIAYNKERKVFQARTSDTPKSRKFYLQYTVSNGKQDCDF